MRTIIDFDGDWKFLKLPKADGLCDLSVESAGFDDSTWEKINLPHTWNAVDGADGWSGTDEGGEHYYRGLGGYRKAFTLPQSIANKRIYIEFEGANTVTEVYINGSFIGKHEGGYSAFRFDITDFVSPMEKNIIAVKVNNAPTNHIAPITDQGDFTKMGGIYRDVKLIVVSDVHVGLMDYGSSGVYITPQNITKDSADIGVLVKLANDCSEDKIVNTLLEIYDTDGKVVSSADGIVEISANQKAEYNTLIKLESPHLWDGVNDPYLYSAKVTVSTSDGKPLDEAVEMFGVRTYAIDPEKGFYLNGHRYDLHGVNYHQDSYENGWAMTDSERERDYNMMFDVGCTTVRMAHYQHDQCEYDLCDRLGLTVWTEIGLVNKMSVDDENLTIADGLADNLKQQLLELIRQNYNHPSVIIWGISNELYQMSDEIFELYTELNAFVKAEDKSRLVSFADAQFWGRFMELPADVVGLNRYFGWYIDGAEDAFGRWLDDYHNKMKRAIAITEYGAGGAISQHKDNIVWAEDIDSWGERHPENYQSAMHEDVWRQLEERPYLWGKYVWCMFDFASDGRQEGDTKGQNDKGLCTREREPKDAFYFYKSVWANEPMLHLTEKRFTERSSLVPVVKAYSNAGSVELFVDGVLQGNGTRTGTVFTWRNVQIKEDIASKIKVVTTLPNGSTLEDNAEWTGIGRSEKTDTLAHKATKEVYQYLLDNFGEVMLSCQQESTWMGSPDYEMNIIEQTTGKLPAMRGLDFMNGDFDGVVERAKAWWEKGGLVTICWHTGINGKGYQESLNDAPDFDQLFDETTSEHKMMIENWDKAAEALLELRDAGVPVFWRPFHEFDGGWFWWGKGGGDNFIKLWRMMHDRFTDEFGLDNLIWVLGYSGDVKDGWYPGDEYCDIIGSDTYDSSTHKSAYKQLEKMNTEKPIAFHECGYVPSIENFEKDGCFWSWFMIWHTDYIVNHDKEELKAVYNHEKVITLDELPKWGKDFMPEYPFCNISGKP